MVTTAGMARAAAACLLAPLLAAGGELPSGRVPATDLTPLNTGRDEVLWMVGEEPVRASDVYRMLDLTAPALSSEVMREIVLMTIVRREAAKEGVDVPAEALEQEVRRALEEQHARFALEVSTEVSLEDYMRERHGMSPSAFEAEVRRSVMAGMLLDRVVRLEAVRRSRDDLQLMLLDDGQLAADVAERLAQGASFSILAKEHSFHPSAAEGGLMPPLPTDVRLPLVAGREALAPGEFLGPEPITLDGRPAWRIVRLVDRHVGTEAPWAELRDAIEEGLAARPVHPDELTLFEARMRDRYRVRRPETGEASG